MYKHFNITYIFLLILFPNCNSGTEKEEIKTLLTLRYTDGQNENGKMEFTQQNTVHFLKAKSYMNDTPDYILSKAEIAKRDSFIQVMTGTNREESYVDMKNDFESHHYSITIDGGPGSKEINIIGHDAPKRYYDFVSWAMTLKTSP